MRRRSATPTSSSSEPARFTRTPEGTINNCALANGDAEANCQICDGTCPDAARFKGGGVSDAGAATLIVGSARAGVKGKPSRMPDLDVGDRLAVTLGREVFSPIRFHTFEVGPFTVEGHVRPGESATDAYCRIYESAFVLFETEFRAKMQTFLGHVTDAAHATKEKR